MDTISRENTSYLPVAGVIVGVLALVLAGVALAKVSSTSKTVSAHTEQLARLDTMEAELRSATTASERASEKAGTAVSALQRSTQDAFNAVSLELGNIKGEVAKLQESSKAPARVAASGAKAAGPVVAGPNEYVVKGGDTGAKIARANNVSLPDLLAVNPGVNWSKLKVGDKVKLPKR